MPDVQPPSPIVTAEQINMLLEEAEAFRRGGAPLDALARARVARDLLAERGDSIDADEAEELHARVRFAVQTYERLAPLGAHHCVVDPWHMLPVPLMVQSGLAFTVKCLLQVD